MDDARFTSAHAQCVPHGFDRHVVVVAGRDPQTIPADVARFVMSCGPFRRLDDHAAAYAAMLDLERATSQARVRPLLEGLVRAGLLLSESSCLAMHDRAAPGAARVETIRSIGVVTRDRPAALRRLLDELVAALAADGRRVRLVVADDSSAPDDQAANRAALSAAGERLGAPVQYVGFEEKEWLIGRLAATTGVARSIVELAVRGTTGVGPTTGANRNALLLATAGELTLQVDDDVRWRLAAAPRQTSGIRFWPSNTDPTEIRFFPDRERTLASAPPVAVDVLALHEALLGRTLGAVAAAERAADRPLVDGPIDNALLCQLLDGTGRIIATPSGIAGDIATWSAYRLLLLRGSSRAALLESWDDAMSTREVVRAVPQVTLARGGFFMATAVGLDNRLLLPPFFPVARNQDGLFGGVTAMCRPDGYFAHLPWLVAHDPDPPRRFGPDAAWAHAGASRVCDLVGEALRTWSPLHRREAPRRMSGLGTHLEEVGTMPDADFAAMMRRGVLRRLDGYRRALQDLLRIGGPRPPAYDLAAERQLVALESRAASPDLLDPADLPPGGTLDERLARVQAVIGRYGSLLRAWPDLVDAAEELRDRT